MSTPPSCPAAQQPNSPADQIPKSAAHFAQPDSGNTKPNPPSRSRGWTITINNPTIKIADLATTFDKLKCLYIFGNEIAPITNTPHIQGYIYHSNKISFKELKSIMPTAHLEAAKGSPYHNRNYCSKEGDFVTNIDEEDTKPSFNEFKKETEKNLLNKYYANVQWKPWQQEILDMLKTQPDARTVHWYWEPKGNTGKSFLAKYIYLTMDAIVASGKKSDIYNQVLTYFQSFKTPTVIITDIARSEYNEHIYTVLENLKNGFIYSGKYEGGVCAFDYPHVVVFANHPPNTLEISSDKWHIVQIQ